MLKRERKLKFIKSVNKDELYRIPSKTNLPLKFCKFITSPEERFQILCSQKILYSNCKLQLYAHVAKKCNNKQQICILFQVSAWVNIQNLPCLNMVLDIVKLIELHNSIYPQNRYTQSMQNSVTRSETQHQLRIDNIFRKQSRLNRFPVNQSKRNFCFKTVQHNTGTRRFRTRRITATTKEIPVYPLRHGKDFVVFCCLLLHFFATWAYNCRLQLLHKLF